MSLLSPAKQNSPLKCQNRFIHGSRVICRFCVAIALSMSAAQIVQAQSWSQLNDDQRLVLAPLEEDWSSLNQGRQKKWLEVANRYPQMSDSERANLKSRMTEWAGLSTKERQSARDNYLRTLKFSAEKKAAAWESYQQLSDEDKKRLAEKKATTTKPTTVTSPTLK
jgi:hypothetical protein